VIRRTIPFFIFFVIALLQLSAEPGIVSISLQTSPETAVKKDRRYSTKAQFGIAGESYLSVDIRDAAFVQAGLGYCYFRPSGPGSDWVIYRGFSSLYFGGGFGFYFDRARLLGFIPLEPGVAFRGFANYANYNYTDIYFFYPSVEIEPFTTAGRVFSDHLEFRIGLPMRWNFQRDLTLFYSVGLSLSGVLYFPSF